MKGRPTTLSGLKLNYFKHIQEDMPPAATPPEDRTPRVRSRAACTCRVMAGCTCSEAEFATDEECTCRGAEQTSRAPRLAPQPSEALAEEALGMLSPADKDEIILQMHAKLRLMDRRLEDLSAASERAVCRQERAHRDAMRERMLSEQRVRQELVRWKHHHPEIADLRLENARLRAENDDGQRQYLAVLGKLARTHRLLSTAL